MDHTCIDLSTEKYHSSKNKIMKYISNNSYLVLIFAVFLLVFSSCSSDCDDKEDSENSCVQKPIENFIGVWEGTFDQYNLSEYPMIMEFNEVEVCNFYGELRWPTLNNSITKMEGYFRNDSLFFTETELTQGSNIILDGAYIATCFDNTIEGIWNYPNNGAEGGNFRITKN